MPPKEATGKRGPGHPIGPRRPMMSQEEIETRLTDLHYALFEELPEEGQKLGWSPMVATSKHLAERLNSGVPKEGRVKTATVGAELRNLSLYGLSVHVRSLGGSSLGWQRTKRATELLEERNRHNEAVRRARTREER